MSVLKVLRPRPSNLKWGEVIANGEVLASGEHSDTTLLFIASCLPAARKVKKTYGVPIAVLIAQTALETGWGQHVKGNAYFGIKGIGSKGKKIDFATKEVIGGKIVNMTDSFRAYTSFEESVMDYGHFLTVGSRYKDCFQFKDDPESFALTLAGDGYATDPNYAAKLLSIIRGYGLAEYDK